MCGSGADGGGEAEGAGETATQFLGRAEVYSGAKEGYRDSGGVEGVVQGMEHHCSARGAVYDHTVPVVGGVEGVAKEEDGKGERHGCGKRSLWQCGRGCSCWGDDAVGRLKNEAYVGEGEREGWGSAAEDLKGVWTECFLCGNGPQSAVDKCWRCCLFR